MEKLLVHCCCAPCASHVLNILRDKYDITCLFYNPNIVPLEERDKRRLELERLVGLMNNSIHNDDLGVRIQGSGVREGINLNNNHTSPISHLPSPIENNNSPHSPHSSFASFSKNCSECINSRLLFTAKEATKLGFSIFTTTLTISPHKNSKEIIKSGIEIANEYGLKFLDTDFKKKDGFLHSVKLSKKYGLYRQNYCGCDFNR